MRKEELYERHARYVYRYLFSLTGDPDTSEELTQETFYQAMKGMDAYRGEAAPEVWLCAIAKRLWFKELARRKRMAGEEALEGMAAPEGPEARYAEREDRLRLYRAIGRLDAETREILHLRLMGDFSFREIGEILGKSEVAARVRFYRGKQELMRMMGGDQDEGTE